MNIKFTPVEQGHCLYYIDMEVDPSMLSELKNQNWVSITPTHLDEYYTKRQRIDGNLNGSIVNSMSTYMHSEFKKVIINLIWKDIMFQHKWGPRLNYDKLDKITKSEFGFNKDLPGFSTDFHLENRSQIAFGMIYFMEQDIPECSTYFYTSESKNNPIRIPTGMGKGWLCVNTHWGWHEGWNNSNNDRYSSSLNFCLDMFNDGPVTENDATIKYIRGESGTI
jgi:hypothetical protein